MVLQYVAASFHLPSVSTANINTAQYPKPYKQYEIPAIPAVVVSKVSLPQSNITAAFVHSHSSLLSDVSSGLPKYKIHVTHFTSSTAVVVVVVVVVIVVVVVVVVVVAVVVVVVLVVVLAIFVVCSTTNLVIGLYF